MYYLGSKYAKSGIQIAVGSKGAIFNVMTSSKITHTYAIEEIHTFPPFFLIQHV